MFVIVTYDVDIKRVDKVRKILRKYLNWVQNSVFEGEITLSNLAKCKIEIRQVISNEDSVYFYQVKNPRLLSKEVVGVDKNLYSNFL
ncbi:CRISPR-associated endonuclease Cas2 [Thermovibrio sp.]